METSKVKLPARRRAIRRLAHKISTQKISKIFEPLISWSGSNFPDDCREAIHETIVYLAQITEDLGPKMKHNICTLNDLYLVFKNPVLSNLKKAKQNGNK